MGRQAYLDKIAFGRSAFEPTQHATSSQEYVQLEAGQSDLPRAYVDAPANSYVQLYDERGNPVNPRANSYSKELRDAQNDVLASVGVVERRPLPSDGLPGSYGEHLELLESEDNTGSMVEQVSDLTETLSTWWIGSLRYRVLTFRYPDYIGFSSIVQAERAVSGPSIFYAGFVTRLFSTVGIGVIVAGAQIYRPLDRLLRVASLSSSCRTLGRYWKQTLFSFSWLALELLFYPFSYRCSLERLGLIPATTFSLLWSSPSPYKAALSLHPFSMHQNASTSAMDFLGALCTAPALYVCAERVLKRWVYDRVSEAVDSSILRPNNPNIPSRDIGNNLERTLAYTRSGKQSPSILKAAVNQLLTAMGWSKPAEVSIERGIEARPRKKISPGHVQDVDVFDEDDIQHQEILDFDGKYTRIVVREIGDVAIHEFLNRDGRRVRFNFATESWELDGMNYFRQDPANTVTIGGFEVTNLIPLFGSFAGQRQTQQRSSAPIRAVEVDWNAYENRLRSPPPLSPLFDGNAEVSVDAEHSRGAINIPIELLGNDRIEDVLPIDLDISPALNQQLTSLVVQEMDVNERLNKTLDYEELAAELPVDLDAVGGTTQQSILRVASKIVADNVADVVEEEMLGNDTDRVEEQHNDTVDEHAATKLSTAGNTIDEQSPPSVAPVDLGSDANDNNSRVDVRDNAIEEIDLEDEMTEYASVGYDSEEDYNADYDWSKICEQLDWSLRPTSPPTPRVPSPFHEDNGPRVSILSRGGTVTMEVYCPSAYVSAITERTDSEFPLPVAHQPSAAQQELGRAPVGPPKLVSHRVTSLSVQPAQMLGNTIKTQLVGIAMLPLKLITLRMIASHYLAKQGTVASRPVKPLFSFDGFSWRSLGVQLSRVALCSMLEVSIDLVLWGVQYVAVTRLGKGYGWGSL